MTFAEDCKKYIQLHAKHARLAARLDVLKERIKPELRTGKHSPRDLPFLLTLRKRMKVLADWKHETFLLLLGQSQNEEVAKQQLEAIECAFPTREDESLHVEINKTFAAKL